MNDNNINLLPNSKHLDDNNETEKHKDAKTRKEDFLMHIPNEEEYNGSEEVNAPKPIDQSAGANNNEDENTESPANADIESRKSQAAKISFFSKIKNIFLKNKNTNV